MHSLWELRRVLFRSRQLALTTGPTDCCSLALRIHSAGHGAIETLAQDEAAAYVQHSAMACGASDSKSMLPLRPSPSCLAASTPTQRHSPKDCPVPCGDGHEHPDRE